MYSVYFGIEKFAEFDNDVNACAIALDLHRLSNFAHHVKVVDENDDIIFNGFKAANDGK